MLIKIGRFVLVVGGVLVHAVLVCAGVPAPPVNQSIGMRDVVIANMNGADCRACHGSRVANEHHELYGTPIRSGTRVPYPDTDGNGIPDTIYVCLSCHGPNFAVEVNCGVCHTTSPHHSTDNARRGRCKTCHGSVVDDMGDGHYIPTYSPSLVTPTPTAGDGLPLNSRGKGAGACDYCHDQDSLATPVIRNNQDLHHGKGFDCTWCHNVHSVAAIRQCEGCHGPGSLHKIQADSPATGNIGTIVVGAELAGYGHIGRDVEPGDSDCWGCHGFAMAAAPDFGPVIPTVRGMNKSTFTAGAATSVVVTGAGFTNTSNVGVAYESTVTLTAANGASVNLTPDVFLDQGSLVVTIPPTIRPGNYLLRASKTGLASNSVRLCVIPKVRITSAAAAPDRTVTINGSGFAGYQKGSGTKVVGMTSTGRMFYGTVVAWSPGKIVARFGTVPAKIKVFSVFGTATRAVTVP